MEANENRALTKAESCYYCKPLVQQRDELAAQVQRLREALELIVKWNSHTTDFAVNFGSNGVRDFYRRIAESSLAEQTPTALAVLKAQWQAEALGEFYDHLQGMALRNGWDTDSDAYHVSEELKSWCQRAQEVGDE